MGVKSLFIFTMLAFAFGTKAQHITPVKDTTLKGQSIEIIQSYKPQIKQAPKPGWIPQLPPADTSRPVFTYDVPPQTLYYTYSSLPLHPLSLVGDSLKLPFPNYVKAGAGNFSTLFLDAGIGGIYGKNYETAIHLHHISQQGNIEGQQSAQSGAEAEGTLHQGHNDWHALAEGERNQYNYYGYNHDQYHYPGDSIKQIYTTAKVAVDVKNKIDTATKFTYNPGFSASLYDAKFSTSESSFGINAPISFKVDSNLNIPIALSGIFTHYKSIGVNANNNIADLMAGLDVHQRPGMNGHAFVSVASGKASSLYILPDLLAYYTIPGTAFTMSAGWQASLRQNTYEQLTNENPYLAPVYTPEQTREDEVFGNALLNTGNHLTLSGRISWWNYNDLPAFLNNTGDQRQFYIDYINAEAVSFQAALNYKVANTLSFGISGDFYDYYGNTGVKVYVWGEPNLKIKSDFSIVPFPKLTITAYLALLNGIWEKDLNQNPVESDLITDVGGNAEYQVIPRLSAFVQLDNLLNENYQRWLGYQSYGLNVYGGLRLKF